MHDVKLRPKGQIDAAALIELIESAYTDRPRRLVAAIGSIGRLEANGVPGERMQSPIDVFRTIWSYARRQGSLEHRNAVCVSTIDADGYPNSRFVDLKGADERGFVFCTRLDSVKAVEIGRNPKAGITLWWEHVATQIRIKGICTAISREEADEYWASRSRDAQIATTAFRQSGPLTDIESLGGAYSRAVPSTSTEEIPRPGSWGGFRLRPEYIEFLEFKENRLHIRTAYTLLGTGWQRRYLQP